MTLLSRLMPRPSARGVAMVRPAFISAAALSEWVYPRMSLNLLLLAPRPVGRPLRAVIPTTEQNEVDIERVIESLRGSPLALQRTYIVLYGRDADDSLTALQIRAERLIGLGFAHVFILPGGMAEWLAMRYVFEAEQFPAHVSADCRAPANSDEETTLMLRALYEHPDVPQPAAEREPVEAV